VALGAAEVLVAGVRLHVGPQVGPVGEGLAAVGAPVRLLPGVRAEVALQQPRPGELLAADAAAVGQLVREQVHRQGGHADVGLAARHALLRRLRVQAPVGLLVPRQVAGGGVLPPALAARVAVQLGGGRVRRLQGLAVGGVVGVLLHHLVELLQKNYCQFGTHRSNAIALGADVTQKRQLRIAPDSPGINIQLLLEVSAYTRASLVSCYFADSAQEIVTVFNYKSAREARFMPLFTINALFHFKTAH
jgi:hypothetical protein